MKYLPDGWPTPTHSVLAAGKEARRGIRAPVIVQWEDELFE